MKTIRNIIYGIAAIFTMLFGIFLVSKNKNNQLDELDTKIKDNNKKLEVIETEKNQVQQKKIEAQKKVVDKKETINDLKTEKKSFTSTDTKTTNQAKNNILSKIKTK
jgi:uncharacterized protein YoxC